MRRLGAGGLLLRPMGALLAFVPVALGACGGDDPSGLDVDASTERAIQSITRSELMTHVRTVAADSMAGRWTPGDGLDDTGRYVRNVFLQAGLQPAFGGEWEQTFELFIPIPGTGINVVGWLEGSDPAFKDEFVVVSAHMDHLGVGPVVDSDSIYNGADDNGSGTAAMLELADAMRRLDVRPRRSVIFAAFGAEEQGLIGSGWYVAEPPLPLENTVANLNMDMLSRNSPDSVAVLRSSPAIGALVDAVAARSSALGLVVAGDPWPAENLLQRSDQWNFIRSGVPGLLMTSGLHGDYHRRTDEPNRIDADKLERVTRLALLILLDLADPAVWAPSN